MVKLRFTCTGESSILHVNEASYNIQVIYLLHNILIKMFGWISGRIKRNKEEDYDDLRSGILGEPAPYTPAAAEPPPARGYEDFTPRTRDIFEPIPTATLPTPEFDTPTKSRDYDIMDRLNLIESQLSSVRSMTETINERLKNMEAKLGMQRRY